MLYYSKEELFSLAFLFTHFYPSMVKLDDDREAQLLLIVATWETPTPTKHGRFLFTGYLGRAHSLSI